MKTLLKPALLAGLVLVAAPQASFAKDKNKEQEAPAVAAPATDGVVVQGIGIADLEAVVQSSDAVRIGAQQRQVTYKAQIDNYQARGKAIQAELQAMADKINADSKAPKPNQAALEQAAAAFQQKQEAGKRELNELIKPVVYSEAYVKEQVEDKLDEAVKNAMSARKITLLLNPDSVLAAQNVYQLSPAILAEVNKAIPTAQLVPPAGWEPRELREARAQQQGAQGDGAPAAPAPAAPASGTSGR